ncbi:T9SS type A sorting domain-containing protein [Viscerimonas tarda]
MENKISRFKIVLDFTDEAKEELRNCLNIIDDFFKECCGGTSKHKKIKLLVIFLAVGLSVQAQQAVVAAGGAAEGSASSVDYSIGQLFYTTNESEEGTVFSGIQLPDEFYSETEVITLTEVNKTNFSVFPNPTVDVLNLQIDNYLDAKWSYQLLNVSGMSLKTELINVGITSISMQGLVPNIYILRIIRDKKNIKP